MRFLLIFPAIIHDKGEVTVGTAIPLGLAYLAAVLMKAGHDVRVVDFQDPNEDLECCLKILKDFKPDAVGLSFMLINAPQAYQAISRIKKEMPNVVILAGGPHPTSSGEDIFKECPGIDIAVRGEADTTIVALADALSKKKELRDIKGISFRVPDTDQIISNPDIDWVEDLNKLPAPARDIFPMESYLPLAGMFKTLPQVPFMTIRGCPYRCIFCNKQTWGDKFTALSAERVVAEIRDLRKRFGYRDVSFYDDSWTIDRKRAHSICEILIKEKLNISWKCATRVDLVDREILEHMKDSGCYSVAFGVESGSERVLKLIKKGITKDQARRAISLCKDRGLETRAYFMINFPTETMEEIEETISFALKLDPDYAAFNIVYPYRGSELRKMVLNDPNIKVFSDRLDALGCNLVNEVYYEQEHLPETEVSRAYRKAYHSFYLRPKYIFKALMRMQNLDQIRSSYMALSRLLGVNGRRFNKPLSGKNQVRAYAEERING